MTLSSVFVTCFEMNNFTFRADGDHRLAIVEFTSANVVEAVPMNWITPERKRCYWPSFIRSSSKRLTAIKQSIPPSDEFQHLAESHVLIK